MRYTSVFEWPNGKDPTISANDGWLGGKLCSVTFADDTFALEKLRELAEDIASGYGNPCEMAIQALDLIEQNRK